MSRDLMRSQFRAKAAGEQSLMGLSGGISVVIKQFLVEFGKENLEDGLAFGKELFDELMNAWDMPRVPDFLEKRLEEWAWSKIEKAVRDFVTKLPDELPSNGGKFLFASASPEKQAELMALANDPTL